MFVDLDLEPFIRAMLDVAPNKGFMAQYNAEELRLFILGEDGRLLEREPLIVQYGMTPIPNVTRFDIQQTLTHLAAEGKVRPTCWIPSGQCYAWNRPDHYTSFYSRRQRIKLWFERRRTLRALERCIEAGEKLLPPQHPAPGTDRGTRKPESPDL